MTTTDAETRPRRATRRYGDTDVPRAGTWRIDPGHTSVEFVGRHLMLTKIRGRITDVEGSVVIGEVPAASSVEVTIGMASISSGNEARDAHLRSPDLLDVERHPTATFRSTGVDWYGATAVVHGELTLLGVARAIDLGVTFVGGTPDPWGNLRTVFSAAVEIDREQWGLTWNMPLDTGGLLVSRQVRLEIESELLLQE